MPAQLSVIDSLQETLARHGPVGCAERLLRVACRHARETLRVREQHIWYQMRLDASLPYCALPDGYECLRGGMESVPLLSNLGALGFVEAQRRLGSGSAELWMLVKNGRAAGACWIFHGRTPVRAARGGWLSLPADGVCLEDTVTAAEHRGLGLAPAAWLHIARVQMRAGMRFVVTKVAANNLASHRAVQKAGFHPIARMNFERTFLRRRIGIEADGDVRSAAFLLDQLAS